MTVYPSHYIRDCAHALNALDIFLGNTPPKYSRTEALAKLPSDTRCVTELKARIKATNSEDLGRFCEEQSMFGRLFEALIDEIVNENVCKRRNEIIEKLIDQEFNTVYQWALKDPGELRAYIANIMDLGRFSDNELACSAVDSGLYEWEDFE